MSNQINQQGPDFSSLSPEYTFNVCGILARWGDLKAVFDEKGMEYTLDNVASVMMLAISKRADNSNLTNANETSGPGESIANNEMTR